jgi:peptidoglycan/xylan/chitin deacetylase (PgdA/CDA1 family)
LDLLASESVKATFFQCGRNAERLPAQARRVAEAGHEIGNHTYSHPALYLRHRQFIRDELELAQQAIEAATGVRPVWFRPTYGCRWFGLRQAQRGLGLAGVMWSTIALDWKLGAETVVKRLQRGIANGAIFCLHDGRETRENPDIGVTIEATRRLIPLLKARGYAMVTVSDLLCRKTSLAG